MRRARFAAPFALLLGCAPVDDLAPGQTRVLAAVDGAEVVARFQADEEELARCTVQDGACDLALPEGEPMELGVEGANLFSCTVPFVFDPDAPQSPHVASGYVPAEPTAYLGWDNPEGLGDPLFLGDPVDISAGCEDPDGDGALEVLLLGLDGILRVEGSELSKEGGGDGWCPPELSPIQLDSRDGGSVWFRPV